MTDQTIEQRAEEFVKQSKKIYDQEFAEARDAAATTATEAWQANYEAVMKKHRKAIKNYAAAIKEGAHDIVMEKGEAEQYEKDIKGEVKLLADERIRHAAWWQRAVDPYVGSVDKCKTIIRQIHAKALEQEEAAPLQAKGLAEAVRHITNSWPSVSWDDKSGVVRIEENESVKQVA